jgi:hypothetical protein
MHDARTLPVKWLNRIFAIELDSKEINLAGYQKLRPRKLSNVLNTRLSIRAMLNVVPITK